MCAACPPYRSHGNQTGHFRTKSGWAQTCPSPSGTCNDQNSAVLRKPIFLPQGTTRYHTPNFKRTSAGPLSPRERAGVRGKGRRELNSVSYMEVFCALTPMNTVEHPIRPYPTQNCMVTNRSERRAGVSNSEHVENVQDLKRRRRQTQHSSIDRDNHRVGRSRRKFHDDFLRKALTVSIDVGRHD